MVLVGVIPYIIVWGGRLTSVEEMRTFEIVSLVINSLIMAVIAMKGGYIKAVLPAKLITILLWLLVGLFSLNTLGNIVSESTIEAIIFTPLTLISAILCYRLAIEN